MEYKATNCETAVQCHPRLTDLVPMNAGMRLLLLVINRNRGPIVRRFGDKVTTIRDKATLVFTGRKLHGYN